MNMQFQASGCVLEWARAWSQRTDNPEAEAKYILGSNRFSALPPSLP